ncbi:hypothetical protein J1N35_022401 [Gossypium stocksii]|uniref:Putative plant transposon protein domain-containing protein n=1 Tax=Gossypium stocksii TaxID=47602 RepID=A0A9D3VG20_9ROSI|nr:hypothetical protein J1N35_022401 [Gossypium stocksii]
MSDLGKQVSKTISKLKWKTFCTHSRSYSTSLVREFYANLYDHELESIFVRVDLIPWDTETINKLYNTKVNVDKHSDFMDDIIDEKCDLLVRDLCVKEAVWMGSYQKNYTMHRRFLTLQGKFWFHFVNCRLKPSTHSTTVTLDSMCLIHSIVKG